MALRTTTSPIFDAAKMVSRAEACNMFGVALRTWSEWQKRGRVRGLRVGRLRLYPLAELEQLRADIRRAEEAYPDPARPGCWRVPVTSRIHKMEAIIDEGSLPLVQGKRFNWSPGQGRCIGSVVVAGTGSPRPPLHQIIMGVIGPQYRIGHVNGDPLDCRKENLVVRTHSEQAAARRKSPSKGGRACSSRFKGVALAESGRKWRVSISSNAHGKRSTLQLGHFRSEIDAALAYDAAARELFGEHARLNFADPWEAEQMRASDRVLEPLYDGFPPPGMLEREDACQMFGIAEKTWTEWERKGRIRCGQFFPLPDDKPGRCKLYPIDELRRLHEEISRLGKPYADPDRPDCYRVPLKGYLEYREALIDAESLPIVEGRNWNWSPRSDDHDSGQVVLAAMPGPNPPLARLIAGASERDDRVMHANGDPLDCRRENLVVKTPQEQTWGNCKMGSINGRKYTSKFKGVSWNKERELWVVQIRKDGKGRRIGMFDDEVEAALAYDEAARELFGEHAWLNFPLDAKRGFAEATALRAAA